MPRRQRLHRNVSGIIHMDKISSDAASSIWENILKGVAKREKIDTYLLYLTMAQTFIPLLTHLIFVVSKAWKK